MKQEIKLYVYHTAEDDPKKCSAKKLYKFGFVQLHKTLRKTPKKCILLNPFAPKALSKEDLSSAQQNGILAVDCSWKNAETLFDHLSHETISRAIPFVVAVNPVNFGKPLKLTTLEAFAAALYILGFVQQAQQLLTIYKWGPHFLKMNIEPLEDYRKAQTSKEVITAMNAYLTSE